MVCDLFTPIEFSLSFSSVGYIILLQTKESQKCVGTVAAQYC
jgi:hypothetical protein